ncbi:cupin domain-containing protein [Martelella sp. HB161492]|uniref:cupin domain-containing protein n=1 Tax=Martelella sp. HB161492 TaxID=2720726 RepID=UPI0015905348|nr:cupin domain-containing protein [Martelella sp. HB161492]
MTKTTGTQPAISGRLSPFGRASFSGIEADILLGDDTGPFTVMDMVVSPGMGAPAHISFHEDKVFHVASGSLLFLVGEDRFAAGPGEHIHVAKGAIHSFSALGSSPARMTLISTPAQHERFFLALSALPVPHLQEAVDAVCQAYDQAIVGPVVSLRPRK